VTIVISSEPNDTTDLARWDHARPRREADINGSGLSTKGADPAILGTILASTTEQPAAG